MEFVWFVFMIRLGFGFWGKRHRGQGSFSSQLIKGTYYQHDLSPPSLAGVVFVTFLHYSYSFPHPFHTVCFGGKSLCVAHTSGVGICALPACRQTIYINYLWILLHGRFVSSPPLTNVLTHLFISVWAHGYLFST